MWWLHGRIHTRTVSAEIPVFILIFLTHLDSFCISLKIVVRHFFSCQHTHYLERRSAIADLCYCYCCFGMLIHVSCVSPCHSCMYMLIHVTSCNQLATTRVKGECGIAGFYILREHTFFARAGRWEGIGHRSNASSRPVLTTNDPRTLRLDASSSCWRALGS